MTAKRDPFFLPPQSVLSFSGGRTSGYMLWRTLKAHGGTMPPDRVVVFCNTGKERLETLDFVERCSQRWGVPVTWLEYVAIPSGKFREKDGKELWKHTYKQVDYATADREGRPYEMAILTRQMLPNPVMRYCTGELKIKTTNRHVRFGLKWGEYDNAIGLRFDEPGRVHDMMAKPRAASTFINLWGEEQENDDAIRDTHPPGEEPRCPLYDARVTLEEVLAFWKEQRGGLELDKWLALPKAERPGWDLELRPDEGNCDLCFLKGADKVYQLIAERPESAQWWIEQEAKIVKRGLCFKPETARFRADRPSYATLLEMAKGGNEPLWKDVDLRPCHCTD